MKKKYKIKSTNYNDVGLRLLNQIFGIEHLHYGIFGKNLKPTIENVPKAQEAYVKKLLSLIPKDAKVIFDVGCGTGGVAEALVKKKYKVSCIAPDPYLTGLAAEKTKGKAKIFTDLYENVSPEEMADGTQDLILMAESCQYIDQEAGWAQNARLLRPKGYVLIADFFKIRPIDRGDISKSGHMLEGFIEIANKHGFALKKKIDITKETAPTMEIYQGIINKYIFPVMEGLFEILSRRYPWTYKLLKKVFGKKVEKLHRRYSNQGPEIFTYYKGYFILLFQKKN